MPHVHPAQEWEVTGPLCIMCILFLVSVSHVGPTYRLSWEASPSGGLPPNGCFTCGCQALAAAATS